MQGFLSVDDVTLGDLTVKGQVRENIALSDNFQLIW